MERTLKMKVIAVGIIAITSLFVFNNIYAPNSITDSKNERFNQWVTYFSEREGLTVEYKNFDAFKGGENTINMQANKMATDISGVRDDVGFTTVYFDCEKDIIFYLGAGVKSELEYCYFSMF